MTKALEEELPKTFQRTATPTERRRPGVKLRKDGVSKTKQRRQRRPSGAGRRETLLRRKKERKKSRKSKQKWKEKLLEIPRRGRRGASGSRGVPASIRISSPDEDLAKLRGRKANVSEKEAQRKNFLQVN